MKKGMMALAIFLTLNVFAGVSSNFSFSSNYFWRGMSQTMDAPAYSGGFDYSSEGGFYAGTWGSNVAFGGAGLELDTYLGYAGETDGGLGWDVGYINYAYPEVTDADFSEIYVALSYAGVGFSYYLGDEFGDYYDISYGFRNLHKKMRNHQSHMKYRNSHQIHHQGNTRNPRQQTIMLRKFLKSRHLLLQGKHN